MGRYKYNSPTGPTLNSIISCCFWTSAEVLVCIQTTWLLKVMMVLWNKSLQSDWSESCDKDELMSSSVLKWENKHFEIRFDALTVWWMRTLSLYILWCCQLWSALFPVDMNTTTTVVFTSTQTHDHNKLLARLIGWLFSSHSFTEESRKYGIFTLILCLVQYCV